MKRIRIRGFHTTGRSTPLRLISTSIILAQAATSLADYIWATSEGSAIQVYQLSQRITFRFATAFAHVPQHDVNRKQITIYEIMTPNRTLTPDQHDVHQHDHCFPTRHPHHYSVFTVSASIIVQHSEQARSQRPRLQQCIHRVGEHDIITYQRARGLLQGGGVGGRPAA